jgi:hypothetical protein
MKFSTIKLKKITIIFISALFLISCSSQRNLLKEEKYIVKEIKSNDLKIELTNVYSEKESFIISGKLSRIRLFNYAAISGHVDVVIQDQQQNIIEKVSIYKSSPFLKYRKRDSSFKVSFSSIPPAGSIIIVGFHKKKFEDYKIFDCGENVAILERVIN